MIKYLYFVLFLFLFVSCSNVKLPDTKDREILIAGELTGNEIKLFLGKNNISGMYCNFVFNSSFSIPDEKWVEDKYPLLLKEYVFYLGLSYSQDTFDCEEFTKLSQVFAENLFQHSKHKSGQKLSIGEFVYTKESTGVGHAVNIFICKDSGGNLKPVFFDPLIYRTVELTEKELYSCIFYRF